MLFLYFSIVYPQFCIPQQQQEQKKKRTPRHTLSEVRIYNKIGVNLLRLYFPNPILLPKLQNQNT